jgi:fructokinase
MTMKTIDSQRTLTHPHSNRIGIDLGGTKIEIVVIGPDNQVTFRERIGTQAELGVNHILTQIQELYKKAIVSINSKTHTLGIGTPGSVSLKTGLLKNSNTVCLNGQPLQELLEHRLQHKLQIENDANCFAMAEALLGAGQHFDLVFGVIMGTGCGGGIVLNQQIRIGPQRLAGEWGHMSIDPNGPLCFCGKRGCVESYISGSGIERIYLEKSSKHEAAENIFKLAKANNAMALEATSIFYDQFGRSFANLINILDPNIIVLGGGLSNEESIYTEGIEAIKKYIFSDELTTPLVKNQLGDSAGVIGAALIGI